MAKHVARITPEQVTELIDLANALLSENRLLKAETVALKYEQGLSRGIKWVSM